MILTMTVMRNLSQILDVVVSVFFSPERKVLLEKFND
jgi:hypothetical protein